MKIVAIAPHPDDAEYGCGGILARAVENNHEVTIICCKASLSELGDEYVNDVGRLREEEARHAADILNCKIEFAKCDPLNDAQEARRNMVKMLRILQPDILIVNEPNDYHPHHEKTSKIVMESCFIAQLPNVKTNETPWQTAQAFYYETFSSVDFVPDCYVDVTHLFVKVRRAFLEHKTGIGVLPLLSHKMNAIHLIRGTQCSAMYAEGIKFVYGYWFDTIRFRSTGFRFLCELNSK
jgi:LmbE family N-acetylglucosaminyl deacetylase